MPILNWLTRDSDISAAKRVPYRLLEEAPELSDHEAMGTSLMRQRATSWEHSSVRQHAFSP
jgi:adenine-specific DNA-methyltransferase